MLHVLSFTHPGVEGISGQCSAGSHPEQGRQLGLSAGLDGRPQWRREAEDGCKHSQFELNSLMNRQIDVFAMWQVTIPVKTTDVGLILHISVV